VTEARHATVTTRRLRFVQNQVTPASAGDGKDRRRVWLANAGHSWGRITLPSLGSASFLARWDFNWLCLVQFLYRFPKSFGAGGNSVVGGVLSVARTRRS